MRSGTCSSCGGSEVYAARNGLATGEHGWAGLRPHLDEGARGIVSVHRTDGLWAYACASCGAMELRLHDPGAIDFIRQRWVRVQPPA